VLKNTRKKRASSVDSSHGSSRTGKGTRLSLVVCVYLVFLTLVVVVVVVVVVLFAVLLPYFFFCVSRQIRGKHGPMDQ